MLKDNDIIALPDGSSIVVDSRAFGFFLTGHSEEDMDGQRAELVVRMCKFYKVKNSKELGKLLGYVNADAPYNQHTWPWADTPERLEHHVEMLKKTYALNSKEDTDALYA